MLEEYHTFMDIEDVELRAWNRCAVIFNIVADEEDAKTMWRDYFNQFTEEDQNSIRKMYQRIKNDGYELTRAAVSRRYNAIRPVYADVE